MQIYSIVLLVAGAVGVMTFVLLVLHMLNVANNERVRFLANKQPVTSVSVHTYKPCKGVIPTRGRIVLETGVLLAEHHNCPLILSVGQTVPGELRTEAEIYAEVALRQFEIRNKEAVILGTDRGVRETSGEVRETLSTIGRIGSSCHVAVGSQPHLCRIALLWRKQHPTMENPRVLLVPIPIPLRYWLWEACMLCVHVLAPPGSRQQHFLLNIIGRRG